MLEDTDREPNHRSALSREHVAQTDVVRDECGDYAETTSRLGDVGISPLADSKQEERQVQETEQENEADGFAEGDDQEDEGDDEPGEEVDAEGFLELIGVVVGGENARVGPEDGRERDPEGTVRREGSRAECVAAGELPHTRKELGKASIEESQPDDNIGVGDSIDSDVVEAQNERRRGKRQKSERTGVRDVRPRQRASIGGEGRAMAFLDVGHFVGGRLCWWEATKGFK